MDEAAFGGDDDDEEDKEDAPSRRYKKKVVKIGRRTGYVIFVVLDAPSENRTFHRMVC